MKNTEAIKILKYMKNYYNNKELDKYDGFELDDNEAIDKAIKILKQTEVKGIRTKILTAICSKQKGR